MKQKFLGIFLQQYWSWSRVSANEMFCRGPVCHPNRLKFVWTIGLCIKLYNRPGNDALDEDISFCALRNILMRQNRFKGPLTNFLVRFFPTPYFRQLFELQRFCSETELIWTFWYFAGGRCVTQSTLKPQESQVSASNCTEGQGMMYNTMIHHSVPYDTVWRKNWVDLDKKLQKLKGFFSKGVGCKRCSCNCQIRKAPRMQHLLLQYFKFQFRKR